MKLSFGELLVVGCLFGLRENLGFILIQRERKKIRKRKLNDEWKVL